MTPEVHARTRDPTQLTKPIGDISTGQVFDGAGVFRRDTHRWLRFYSLNNVLRPIDQISRYRFKEPFFRTTGRGLLAKRSRYGLLRQQDYSADR